METPGTSLPALPIQHPGPPLQWYEKAAGKPLCWDVQTMTEPFPKYLDKAATKARALVPNATAVGSCVPADVFTVC